MKVFLKKCFLLYILLFIFSFSDASEKEQVDLLLENSLTSFAYQRFQLSFQQADSAYVIANKIDYSEGIVRSTLYKIKSVD